MMTTEEFSKCFKDIVKELVNYDGRIASVNHEEKEITLNLFTDERAIATASFHPETETCTLQCKTEKGDVFKTTSCDATTRAFKETLRDFVEYINDSDYTLDQIKERINRYLPTAHAITDSIHESFKSGGKWYHFESIHGTPPVLNFTGDYTTLDSRTIVCSLGDFHCAPYPGNSEERLNWLCGNIAGAILEDYNNDLKTMEVLKPAFREAVKGLTDEPAITETKFAIGTLFYLADSSPAHFAFGVDEGIIELRLTLLDCGLRETFDIHYGKIKNIPRIVKAVVDFIMASKSVRLPETLGTPDFVEGNLFDSLVRELKEYIGSHSSFQEILREEAR